MINLLYPILAAFVFLSFSSGVKAQCYELIWSEEFDYTGFPDPSIWTFEVGGGGWGNNELQYYKANDEDNAWVEDGRLTITAINESFGGRNYTSARIITRDKFSVQYGKIEARMKLPYGKGIWPAFWALGQDYGTVGWPACGEIDIMEFVGGPTSDDQIHGTAHWEHNGSHAQHGGNYRLPAGTGIFADDYHVFSIIWTPQYIRWYINDIQYHALDIRNAQLSEFHQDFFLILNLAVGGNWPGSPDGTTVFPQTFEIDYIRVYKNTNDVEDLPMMGDTILPPSAKGQEFSLPAAPGWSYEWSVPDDAVIESGQGTDKISVNWGCTDGAVSCIVTGDCGEYTFTKNVILDTRIFTQMFVGENEDNVLFYTDPMTDATYEWVVPEDAIITEGQGTDSVYVNWGNTFGDIVLNINNICGDFAVSHNVIRAGQYPFPDIGSPHIIPGTIEAVDFDYGGPGVAFHDSSAGNQGPGPRQDTDVDTQYLDNGSPNVGWILPGEWLEYSVKVEQDSFYRIDARLATFNASGGPFSILFNNEVLLSGIMVFNTGGWESFVTRNIGTVYLSESDTIMRILFNGGGFNIGRITFTPTVDPNLMTLNNSFSEIDIYPNPSSTKINISSDLGILNIGILDLNGKLLRRTEGIHGKLVDIDISNYQNGIYFLRIETSDNSVTFRRIIKIE